MKSIKGWKFKLSLKNVLFLLACLIFNFAGKFLATALSLPFWFDSAGTCLSGIVLGPLGGVIVGSFTNIVNEIIFGSSLPYIVVSIAIGIAVGYLYPRDNEFFQTVFTAIFVSIMAIIISTPLNLYFYDGYTGNLWGDAMFTMLLKHGFPKVVSCVIAQAFTDIPDKAITLLVISCMIKMKVKLNNKEAKNA